MPRIEAWIDNYVGSGKHRYRTLAALGFPRLKAYFSPALLDWVQAAVVPKLEVPPMADIGPVFADLEALPTVSCGITYRQRKSGGR